MQVFNLRPSLFNIYYMNDAGDVFPSGYIFDKSVSDNMCQFRFYYVWRFLLPITLRTVLHGCTYPAQYKTSNPWVDVVGPFVGLFLLHSVKKKNVLV